MDVDPNYDPSDFLMAGLPVNRQVESFKEEETKVSPSVADFGMKIQDDLAVSESEDEASETVTSQHVQEDEDAGDLWF